MLLLVASAAPVPANAADASPLVALLKEEIDPAALFSMGTIDGTLASTLPPTPDG
jgi:hypothetical protein